MLYIVLVSVKVGIEENKIHLSSLSSYLVYPLVADFVRGHMYIAKDKVVRRENKYSIKMYDFAIIIDLKLLKKLIYMTCSIIFFY